MAFCLATASKLRCWTLADHLYLLSAHSLPPGRPSLGNSWTGTNRQCSLLISAPCSCPLTAPVQALIGQQLDKYELEEAEVLKGITKVRRSRSINGYFVHSAQVPTYSKAHHKGAPLLSVKLWLAH